MGGVRVETSNAPFTNNNGTASDINCPDTVTMEIW